MFALRVAVSRMVMSAMEINEMKMVIEPIRKVETVGMNGQEQEEKEKLVFNWSLINWRI